MNNVKVRERDREGEDDCEGWMTKTGERREELCSRKERRRREELLQPYHERPLLDLQQDDVSALRHPGQQYGDGTDGQPADVQPTRRRVELVDLGAARPERHQPAARAYWTGEDRDQSD